MSNSLQRCALTAAAASLLITGSAAAQVPSPTATRTETQLPSRGDSVTASVVRLDAPMPAGTPVHPAACDTISYLRLRSASGPTRARRSDAVMVTMPGILAGSASLEITGRNAVRAAGAARPLDRVLGAGSALQLHGGPLGTHAGPRRR